jgi:hypothetical protein
MFRVERDVIRLHQWASWAAEAIATYREETSNGIGSAFGFESVEFHDENTVVVNYSRLSPSGRGREALRFTATRVGAAINVSHSVASTT